LGHNIATFKIHNQIEQHITDGKIAKIQQILLDFKLFGQRWV
jgi:hypothetical protein